MDTLQQRFADLLTLEDGWDGPGSVRPAPSAVGILEIAARALTDSARATLGASAHADGYVSVTLTSGKVHRFADIYDDHIEYELYPSISEPWEGTVNSADLRKFLVG